MAEAEVILDSQHPNGSRLITMTLRLPTSVLAQFNTHRQFSRNAASMRAIPTKRIVADVVADPYVPEFLSNRPGMQGGGEVPHPKLAKALWLLALRVAVVFASLGSRLGLHKQVINRLLSPWSYTRVLTTGTAAAWANFFHLRCDSHADPAIRSVALAAAKAIMQSEPRPLSLGEWHLPYYTEGPQRRGWLEPAMHQSVARCARVSYGTFDSKGKSTPEKDAGLYQSLVGSDPKHASPAEHQAQVRVGPQKGNFGDGWAQHRHDLPNESVSDLTAVLRRVLSQ